VESIGNTFARGFHPAYVIPVLIGLALTIFFPASRAIEDPIARRKYRVLQLCTLIGALTGAKLAAIVGDLRFPLEPITAHQAFFETGRSITGGLLFGFLTAELLKPLLRYHEPPNNRFATILPFSIAIGRVGCLFAGCCLGIEWHGPWAMADAEGILRHPAALYDLVFHVILGVIFIVMSRRKLLPGRFFAIHLIAYGIFRFSIEPLRDTRDYLGPLSAYQLFALAMIPCGLYGLTRRLRSSAPVSHAEPARS
jgi:phosphatidylglycerol---prolipoprotein diacylglyceryl transferase